MDACLFCSMIQSDREEYQAACKLWEVYLQTRNEFVQPGDGDDEEEDGDDVMDNSGVEYVSSCFRVLTSCLCPFHILIQTQLKCVNHKDRDKSVLLKMYLNLRLYLSDIS